MEHVSTDKNKNMIQNICNKNEGVSYTRCAFFFFVDYKNRLIFLSCDILRISLIYVFATSKYKNRDFFREKLEFSGDISFCL